MPKNENNKCFLLINPNRFPQYVKILKKIVKRYPIFHVIESEDYEHFLVSIDEYYYSKKPFLLIWGGDGTAHSAINRLTELRIKHPEDKIRRSIGFLRGGSGNGIQDSYEVPFSIFKQLKTYIHSMENNYAIDVDLIEVDFDGKTEYTQLAGVGFDAYILNIRDNDKYKSGPLKGIIKPGMWNYLSAVSKALFVRMDKNDDTYKLKMHFGRYIFQGTRVNAEIKFDHLEKECNPLMIEVGNRPYFAALFKICPHVVCNSGSMNLYVYNKMTRGTMLMNLWYFWTGQHNRINDRFAKKKRPIIENFEIKSSQISSKKPFHFHMDGDLRKVETALNGKYNLDFTILPESITFLVPEVFFNKFHPAGI
ncbi:MAG: sphingosine kinase [Spirochaetaceae bacterium]|nr:sphingosine kinase [Spirochaetaceae bacterium]